MGDQARNLQAVEAARNKIISPPGVDGAAVTDAPLGVETWAMALPVVIGMDEVEREPRPRGIASRRPGV